MTRTLNRVGGQEPEARDLSKQPVDLGSTSGRAWFVGDWLVDDPARFRDLARDRVYMWEAGPDAGIQAVGQVLDKPAMRPELPAEAPFVRR